jgi:hypothetical protein
MPEACWGLIDRLTVSWYSSRPLPEERVEWVRRRCDVQGVHLTIKRIAQFQRMNAPSPNSPQRACEVFSSCWLKTRCHMVHDARFYLCTRPPGLNLVRGAQAQDDGLALAQVSLRELIGYLERAEPLVSCQYCLGARGEWIEHRQGPS